VTGNQKKQQLN